MIRMDGLLTQEKIACSKMKLAKSSDTGYIVGFASKNPKTGAWHGVRQDSSFPKKVCVLDRRLIPYTLTNRLYNVSLVPMKNKDGFVIVEASPVMFEAKVNSFHVKKQIYRVEVTFGGYTIIYDPMEGRKSSVKNLQEAVETLEKRTDIADIASVVEIFAKEATVIQSAFQREMPELALKNMVKHYHKQVGRTTNKTM